MTVVMLTVVVMTGCGKSALPAADKTREFGADTFVVITGVDKTDPSVFLLAGTVGIKDGKMTTSMPGAVFVVGVPDSVTVGGKTFTSRQIILLTSNSEHILAPPGMTITIPGDIEVLGKTYKAGQFTVPKDSKLPESM